MKTQPTEYWTNYFNHYRDGFSSNMSVGDEGVHLSLDDAAESGSYEIGNRSGIRTECSHTIHVKDGVAAIIDISKDIAMTKCEREDNATGDGCTCGHHYVVRAEPDVGFSYKTLERR